MKIIRLFVAVCVVVAMLADSTSANKRLAVYPNWPACKKATEYVTMIRKSDRVEGAIYHERKKGQNVKTYICEPCTECLPGIAVLEPCSDISDTQCSMGCAVLGCVVDEFLQFCRLPGDPNNFDSIAAMMDPCDISKAKFTTEGQVIEEHIPIPIQDQLVDSFSARKGITTGLPTHEPESPIAWGTLEMTAVFVSIVFLIVLMNVMIIYVVYRKYMKGAQAGQTIMLTNQSETQV